MIREIEIENFKSISKLTLSLGQVNVLIGANGSGKSNILEAIAITSAAANDKLDNEFLASRGIRVSEDPHFMRSAFEKQKTVEDIALSIRYEQNDLYTYTLQKDDDQPYAPWTRKEPVALTEPRSAELFGKKPESKDEMEMILSTMRHWAASDGVWGNDFSRSVREALYSTPYLRRFLVFSPENSALRTFQEEGQVQPLGIRGEGLFKLLRVLQARDENGFEEIKSRLQCIDWFADFEIASDLSPGQRSLQIRDRFLDNELAYFDQKSANEGFLFLLFYFCLFVSKDTPPFFAIDNLDASLNPKLCSHLMMELAELARTKGKQVICTTHNPAILDGLDLTDDEQRLFVVSRNRDGHTRIKRIPAPRIDPDQTPVRLSEAFLRGYLGGLADNF